MKIFCLLAILIVISLAPATQGQADMLVTDIDPTDDYTNPQWLTPSNWATEETWLERLLGFDVFYYGKDEDDTWNDGSWTEGDSSFDWTYAVLKYGVGKPAISNPDHWAIEDTNGDDNVNFFDISGLPSKGLSHITYFGPPPSPVPEPSTMLLLCTGLIGLVRFRRKFRKT